MDFTNERVVDCLVLGIHEINQGNIGQEGKLILGNTRTSLEKIDTASINLTITSPPYNKQGKNRKGRLVKDVGYDKYKDALPESSYQKNQIAVLDELHRTTVSGGSLFYNHKVRWDKGVMIHPMDWLRKTKWVIRQEIVWDRIIAGNIRGWRFWQIEERIYWLYKPIGNNIIGRELESKSAKLSSVWRAQPESGQKNKHPAPFPLWLPTRIIISLLSEETECVILDPYSGSGTTAVASKLLGHKYIGIDISESYIKMSSERLDNAMREIHSISEELALHKVDKTFNERKASGDYLGKYSEEHEDLQHKLFPES